MGSGKLKVAVLRSSTDLNLNRTGGARYQAMVIEALRQFYEVNVYYLYYKEETRDSFFKRLIKFAKMVKGLRVNTYKEDVFILDRRTMFLVRRVTGKRYIGLTHHYDIERSRNILKRLLLRLSVAIGFGKVDVLVAVSDYWKYYFGRLGAKNVHVIHNSFHARCYSDLELKEFKFKYNLEEDRPIIYMGVNAKEKGVIDVYEALKNKGYLLVTSGLKNTDIPSLHLDLTYDEYLKLLAVSSLAIIMSKLPEGWSRTAHEAMLMKTPVIGSGIAGMHELLEGGGQIVCNDLSRLNTIVDELLNNPDSMRHMGEKGFEFARQFTFERFSNDWVKLVRDVNLGRH